MESVNHAPIITPGTVVMNKQSNNTGVFVTYVDKEFGNGTCIRYAYVLERGVARLWLPDAMTYKNGESVYLIEQ